MPPKSRFSSRVTVRAAVALGLLLSLISYFWTHKRNSSDGFSTEWTRTAHVTPLDMLQNKRSTNPKSDAHDPIAASYRGEYGWRFARYIPSALEAQFQREANLETMQDWSTLVAKYSQRARDLEDQSANIVLPDTALDASLDLTCTGELNMQNGCFDYQPADLNKQLFSRFEYEFVCLGEPCSTDNIPPAPHPTVGAIHTSYIEPLWGSLRHPLFFESGGGAVYLVNKSYMIVDKWALHHLHTRWRSAHSKASHTELSRGMSYSRRASIFVDIGASTYATGPGGASQNWFVGLGACMCTPLSDMLMFEATPIEPRRFWDDVPPHVRAGYRWHNYPIETSSSSWLNPLNHLLRTQRTDDVVIVKVDFDSPLLEDRIIESILDFPELYRTIDELFFEFHVNMPQMVPHWSERKPGSTIVTAIDLFTKLRRRGIRAHAWV